MNLKKKCLSLLLVCAIFCLWYNSFLGMKRIQKTPASSSLFLNQGLSADNYERLLKTEALAPNPLSFVLWEQEDGALLKSIATERTSEVSVLKTRGDTRLLFPVPQAYLEPGDTNGCIIDRQTSFELWGSYETVGNELLYDDKAYQVRVVLDSPKATFMIQSGPDKNLLLHSITISGIGGAENFSQRHGMQPVRVENSLSFYFLSATLTKLPVLFIGGFFLQKLIHFKKGCPLYPNRQIFFTFLIISLTAALFFCLLTMLPPALIPTRWSDFSFWQKAFASWISSLSAQLTAPKLRPSLPPLALFLQTASSIPAILLLHLLFHQGVIWPSTDKKLA